MATQESIVNSKRNEYHGVRSDCEGAMKSDDEWVNLVKGILRAEMARRGITYDQLAAKLAELGIQDTAVNIRNKVARGGFSAVFFVQCLRAIGCQTVRLDYE
jgi:3-mercaptopyruvate sulfurtransferase SseA